MISIDFKLGGDICRVLGIDPKTVTDLRIDCDVAGPTRITFGRVVTVDEANQISAIVEQYELTEIGEGDTP